MSRCFLCKRKCTSSVEGVFARMHRCAKENALPFWSGRARHFRTGDAERNHLCRSGTNLESFSPSRYVVDVKGRRDERQMKVLVGEESLRLGWRDHDDIDDGGSETCVRGWDEPLALDDTSDSDRNANGLDHDEPMTTPAIGGEVDHPDSSSTASSRAPVAPGTVSQSKDPKTASLFTDHFRPKIKQFVRDGFRAYLEKAHNHLRSAVEEDRLYQKSSSCLGSSATDGVASRIDRLQRRSDTAQRLSRNIRAQEFFAERLSDEFEKLLSRSEKPDQTEAMLAWVGDKALDFLLALEAGQTHHPQIDLDSFQDPQGKGRKFPGWHPPWKRAGCGGPWPVARVDELRQLLFSCKNLSGGSGDRTAAEAKEAEVGAEVLRCCLIQLEKGLRRALRNVEIPDPGRRAEAASAPVFQLVEKHVYRGSGGKNSDFGGRHRSKNSFDFGEKGWAGKKGQVWEGKGNGPEFGGQKGWKKGQAWEGNEPAFGGQKGWKKSVGKTQKKGSSFEG